MRASAGPARSQPDDPPLTYALLDAGDGRRLERFGEFVLDRPAPRATAPRREPARWREADLRFDAGLGWSGRVDPVEPWTVAIADLALELRATSSGGVGLYPEHAVNLAWLEREVAASLAANLHAHVLNLFAHTGLATLTAARAGASVAHVDAARGSVAWARRNASLNGLEDREIRWLVDDAQAFVEREARRDRRYEGLILDPPSSGHGGSSPGRAGRWTLRSDLPRLLAAASRVLVDGGFVLLTAHSTGLDGAELAYWLAEALPATRSRASVERLGLVAESGAHLELGWAVRLGREPIRAGGEPISRNAAP